MASLERRIEKLESQLQGDAIETFEQLMDESLREWEAAQRGIPFTPKRFSEEIVRTFQELLSDPTLDPETRDAIRGALQERGHL